MTRSSSVPRCEEPPLPARAIANLAWLAPGKCDQVFNRAHAERRRNDIDKRLSGDERNRGEVFLGCRYGNFRYRAGAYANPRLHSISCSHPVPTSLLFRCRTRPPLPPRLSDNDRRAPRSTQVLSDKPRMISVPPPVANGTTMRIDFVG